MSGTDATRPAGVASVAEPVASAAASDGGTEYDATTVEREDETTTTYTPKRAAGQRIVLTVANTGAEDTSPTPNTVTTTANGSTKTFGLDAPATASVQSSIAAGASVTQVTQSLHLSAETPVAARSDFATSLMSELAAASKVTASRFKIKDIPEG
jgi:hypothetical protein